MADKSATILELKRRIQDFVEVREWEPFHNPKDLAMGITIEAAELMELFLWKDQEEVNEEIVESGSRNRIEEELADIVILCLSLANRLKIDVTDAVVAKVAANEAKYPADLVRGKARKYTEYINDP